MLLSRRYTPGARSVTLHSQIVLAERTTWCSARPVLMPIPLAARQTVNRHDEQRRSLSSLSLVGDAPGRDFPGLVHPPARQNEPNHPPGAGSCEFSQLTV